MIELSEYLDIIGEPDEPLYVEQLWIILLSFIPNIIPFENDISFPFGYCNINISLSLYISIEFLIIWLSILKYSLILSFSYISIHV